MARTWVAAICRMVSRRTSSFSTSSSSIPTSSRTVAIWERSCPCSGCEPARSATTDASIRSKSASLPTDAHFAILTDETAFPQFLPRVRARLDADDESETIPISEENLEDILDWCGRRLGEGLHQEYWRARRVAGVSGEQATLELFYLLRDRLVAKIVEDAAQVEFDRLWEIHRATIRALPTSKADAYRAIRGMAIEPATV